MFSFECLWQPFESRLLIVDVGAYPVPETTEIYAPLLEMGLAELVGFEAEESGYQQLNTARQHCHYYPWVIGDGHTHTLYHTARPFNSSLFKPNLSYLQDFDEYPALFQVTHTSQVRTRALDSITAVAGCAFLKLDVQGAEHLILSAAPQTLATTMIVHTEVEFEPIYENQPLFGDIDRLLRHHGFRLHTFQGVYGGAYQPFITHKHHSRQVLWSDAVYIRDVSFWQHCSMVQLLALATVLHHCYHSYDLAAKALGTLDKCHGFNYLLDYLTWLQLLGYDELLGPNGP